MVNRSCEIIVSIPDDNQLQFSPLVRLVQETTPYQRAASVRHGAECQMERMIMLKAWYNEGRRESWSISELLYRTTLG